jgi:hypothetical protein
MIGRGYQREPIWISDSIGIAINFAILDGGDWTPEAEGVLAVHAADKPICKGSIGHGKSRAVSGTPKCCCAAMARNIRPYCEAP